MKTKIWVGVLFYSFMGCANKAPKSNLTSKSIPKEPEGYGVRYIPVQEEPVEENTVYEEVVAKAMILAKKMVNKLTKVLDCDGYNIVQNNEECAGQSVFHFHMHLIPRYKGDQVGLGWKMGELSEEDKKEILDKMK